VIRPTLRLWAKVSQAVVSNECWLACVPRHPLVAAFASIHLCVIKIDAAPWPEVAAMHREV
jgi:hypothetical protein